MVRKCVYFVKEMQTVMTGSRLLLPTAGAWGPDVCMGLKHSSQTTVPL